MGDVVNFPRQSVKMFRPACLPMELRGRIRDRWCVVVRDLDGSESLYGPMKTQADAVWLAAELAEADRKRRAEQDEDDDWMEAVLAMPRDERRRMLAEWRAKDSGKGV